MSNEELVMKNLKNRLAQLDKVQKQLDPVADFASYMKINDAKNVVIDKIMELDKASDARKHEDNMLAQKRLECETNLEIAKMNIASQEKVNKMNSKANMVGMIVRGAFDLGGAAVTVGSNVYNGIENRRTTKELGYAGLGITDNSVIRSKEAYNLALKSLERR